MARVYEVDYAQLGGEGEDIQCPTQKLLKAITKYVLANHPDIRRGDVVQHIMWVDRNDTKCIWDGKQCIPLGYDREVDEYGHVPPQFMVSENEFRVDWWDDAIAHNKAFWVHPEVLKTLKFEVTEPDPSIKDELDEQLDHVDEDDGERFVRAILHLHGEYTVYARSGLMNREALPVFFRHWHHDYITMKESDEAKPHPYTFECEGCEDA